MSAKKTGGHCLPHAREELRDGRENEGRRREAQHHAVPGVSQGHRDRQPPAASQRRRMQVVEARHARAFSFNAPSAPILGSPP